MRAAARARICPAYQVDCQTELRPGRAQATATVCQFPGVCFGIRVMGIRVMGIQVIGIRVIGIRVMGIRVVWRHFHRTGPWISAAGPIRPGLPLMGMCVHSMHISHVCMRICIR
jgi:hypothetical protein